MIDVPESFERTTLAREGADGAPWLSGLPGLVGELCARWELRPGPGVTHGGVGLVVPVRRGDGSPAVLKVSFPHPGNVHEPDAFEAWRGNGAVRLYARDDASFAMLLERAGTGTLAEHPDGDTVVTVAAGLARRLAVPVPAGGPALPRLSARAARWERELRADAAELSHGMSGYAVDAAVATARELGREQPESLVHGDLHGRNILPAEREPWLAVDPKGLVGDPAYDVGALLKSRVPSILPLADPAAGVRRVLDLFADTAELDPGRVRRWAQFHIVRAAFWGRRHGFRVTRGGELDAAVVTRAADSLAHLLAS
ncbi:aminoglycoside phosphotransferase family protein (plasmid) [Streptomyces sp. BI20]|uniref:aminoglycoside phosphotransferase family protein n=1 Tax=Streptomyces sp. BI20 TaxID=3403460 RepID=UPI003C73C230